MPYRWHSVEKETQMILTKHEYYDDELRTLVQDRDRPLIERVGYTFKQPS